MHESIAIMADIENEPNSNLDIASLDKIANKLIKDGFLLTALEFHAELIESGKELPRLRDFFSNPANFEKQTEDLFAETTPVGSIDASNSVLPRTSSEQTFDSLDFARYSDDGERQIDERIAVLEFELRKARETIKSLRASLTVSSAAESAPSVIPSNISVVNSVTNTCSQIDLDDDSSQTAKPHEIRAINFLINEYLMKHNYKLTSITFCDENEEQDFESWDDVGLNVSKPPDLVKLYRLFWWNSSKITSELSSDEPMSSKCIFST